MSYDFPSVSEMILKDLGKIYSYQLTKNITKCELCANFLACTVYKNTVINPCTPGPDLESPLRKCQGVTWHLASRVCFQTFALFIATEFHVTVGVT